MNLKEQLYICTLARCGTITKAAEELFISPPAISVFLSNLEKYLGVKLFERTAKSLILTPIGEEYVKRAEKMLEMKREFDSLVEQESGKYKGSLRVGIQHRRSIPLAASLTSCFLKEYPEVNLLFREGIHDELIRFYQNNTIDFLVCTYTGDLADTEYVELCKEQILIALPKDHPAGNNAIWKEGEHFPSLNPSCLNQETFILPKKEQSLRRTAERIFEQYRIHPSRIIEISYFETVMSMVEAGIGVGFNRSGYISAMEHFSKVRYYMVGETPYASRLVLAYRKGRKLTPYMERFIELIKMQISKS